MRPLVLILVLGLLASIVFGLRADGKRKAAEVRADSALASYGRLAADSVATREREQRADSTADSLRQQVAVIERATKDTIAAVTRTLAALDLQAATTLPAAKTVRDSMEAYQKLYTEQRAATGRLLAAAAAATGDLLSGKDAIIANRDREAKEARTDRDRWKREADRLKKSVDELKGGGRILFGLLPRPPKWAAALIGGTVGCTIGAVVETQNRGNGCVKGGGIGGATATVLTPTD